MSKNWEKTAKNIGKGQEFRKTGKNRQKYRKKVKNVQKTGRNRQTYQKNDKNLKKNRQK